MTYDPRYPFGTPINRPPPSADLVPIPGRKNWFRHRVTGAEVYREPQPVKPAWPFPSGKVIHNP